jgi:mRNA interferase MazF
MASGLHSDYPVIQREAVAALPGGRGASGNRGGTGRLDGRAGSAIRARTGGRRSRLVRGSIVWVDLGSTLGREQRGQRPAVVVSSDDYIHSVPELLIVVPLTMTDRGWPHHVRVAGPRNGLTELSFAMMEQPRTVARQRVASVAGTADPHALDEIESWLSDFLSF